MGNNAKPIADLVAKVSTWNPLQSSETDDFLYVDLSSINKETKTIIAEDVPLIAPGEAPSRARQILEEGDVLVSTVRPNLNGVALVGDQFDGATASTGYCVLRPNQNKLDSKYLFYWVQSPQFIESMMKQAIGANYPAVSDRIVKASEIPLPPLVEQKRISIILEKAETLRRNHQHSIDLAEQLLRSVFLEMFGDPISNPKKWELKPLSSLTKKPITYGILKPEEYINSGIPMLRIQDLKNGKIVDSGFHKVSHQLSNQYKRTILNGGEIIISLVGTLGLTAVVPESLAGANVHRNLGVVAIKDESLTHYIATLMRLPQFGVLIDRVTKGGVHKLLNLAELSALSIPVPPESCIKEFIVISNSIEEFSSKQKQSKKDYSNLFSSLSQQAFAGQL